MCGAHAAVRHLLGGMQELNVITVIDMEAGLEHLSRGTDRHVDALLVVAEPYFKALETARRCVELGRELKIPRVAAVARRDEDFGALAKSVFWPVRERDPSQRVWTDDYSNIAGALLRNLRERRPQPGD